MSGISYTMPRFQAIDQNGRPMVGATLYTYKNKTTTPHPTWKDKDQTTYNTNPIVLDARGEAVVWLDPEQVYTFVLRDSFGVLVWSQDDVAGGAAQIDLAAPDGASMVGFIQEGTGAVPRTMLDKAREVVSVKDFGAVGDGVADDTEAVQKAIDAGITCDISGGVFSITHLVLRDGQKIIGDGTLLARASGSLSLVEMANNTMLSGIKLDCDGKAIRAIGGLKKSQVKIRDVSVSGSMKVAPPGLAASCQFLDCAGVDVFGLHIRDSDSGLLLMKCRNSTVRNISGENLLTADKCLVDILFDSNNIIVDGVTAKQNTRYAVRWVGGDAADVANKDVWINDSYPVTDYETYGAPGTSHAAVYGLVISNVTQYGSGNQACVWGKKGQGISVSSCYSDECSDVAFDAETCRDVLFTGCVARNAAFGGFATFYYGYDITFSACHALIDDPAITNIVQLKGTSDGVGTYGVRFVDCTFTARNGQLGMFLIERGPGSVSVKDCTFNDCYINVPDQRYSGPPNTMPLYIDDNEFRLTVEGSYSAILLKCTMVSYIRGNSFIRTSAEGIPTEENAAIYTTKNNNSFRYQEINEITDNTIRGWTYSITTDGSSDVDGAYAAFIVKRNGINGLIRNKEFKTDGVTPFTRFSYVESDNVSLNGVTAVAKVAY